MTSPKAGRWWAACDHFIKMGPYQTEIDAYRALRMLPRQAATQIVATNFRAPDLGLRLVNTAEVKEGTLAPGARVWEETRK